MTGRNETRAAALIVAAAFVFGFGMFTIGFGATFDSIPAIGLGAAQVGASLGAVRKSTAESSYPVGGAA